MQVPDRLGKYQIRRELGRGAMGVVYEGYDPLIERAVAIKVLRLDEADPDLAAELRMRFRREAQAAGRLGHPGIIAVYEYGEDTATGSAFIAMELVRGRDLKTLFGAGTRFTLDETGRLMASLLAALQHAHERGVVHRDIKPGNIILLENGAVKIADFGIAKLDTSELTQLGSVLGTVSHMAPEQLTGDAVDGRSDLYACGVILYQLLTGERPFTGTPAALMHKVLHEQPPPPSQHVPGLPQSFDRVVRTAMAKQPDQRYASATAFAAALGAALDEARAPVAEPAPASDGAPASDPDATVVRASVVPPQHAGRRRTLVAATLGVAIAVAVGVAAFRLLGTRTGIEPRALSRASDPITASPAPAAASATAVVMATTDPSAGAGPTTTDRGAAAGVIPATMGAGAATGAGGATTDAAAAPGGTTAAKAAPHATASSPIVATAPASATPSGAAPKPPLRAAPTPPLPRAAIAASATQTPSPAAAPPTARATAPSAPASSSAVARPPPALRVVPLPDAKVATLPAPAPAPAPPIVALAPKSTVKAADGLPPAAATSEGKAAAGVREPKAGPLGPSSSAPAGESARVEARIAPADGARPAARPAPPAASAPTSASAAAGRTEGAECLEEARRGNARCQVVVGNLYRNGRGVPRDPAEAARWYRKAAEQGSDAGQYELGLLYEYGLGVAADPVAAVSWYRKAAAQSHARAQNRLGSAYENGSVGPRNPVLAADWYRKAADQNLPIGLYNLGRLYLAGRGVFKDISKGQALIQAAADQGEPNAMVMLAGMYARGEGKPRDREQATRLYRDALARPGLNDESRTTAQRALASAR